MRVAGALPSSSWCGYGRRAVLGQWQSGCKENTYDNRANETGPAYVVLSDLNISM